MTRTAIKNTMNNAVVFYVVCIVLFVIMCFFIYYYTTYTDPVQPQRPSYSKEQLKDIYERAKKKKDPPIGASAVYMASNKRMPEEIMTGLMSLRETEDEVLWNGNEAAIMTYEKVGKSMKEEHKLIQMDELATRLIDSAMERAKA